MGVFGYLGGINVAMDSINASSRFVQTIESKAIDSVSTIWSFHRPLGETNRYSKEHQDPIPIDSIPAPVPDQVKSVKIEKYEYEELNPQTNEIRILELLPRNWHEVEDFVACRLLHKSLDENPQFEALSYTWGRKAGDVPIFIDPKTILEDGKVNEAIKITPTLYVALKRFRSDSTSRYLWIDQICIDQQNAVEKASQVQLVR
jgi:Heterokaryon incompatibility protein (HET)